MSERDELADVLQQYALASDGDDSMTWADYAGVILAAGYRKPRTVTTVEELDALGFEAVVLDPCGTPAVCQRSTQTESYWTFGGLSELIDSDTLLLSGSSCTVLHDGDVSHRAEPLS